MKPVLVCCLAMAMFFGCKKTSQEFSSVAGVDSNKVKECLDKSFTEKFADNAAKTAGSGCFSCHDLKDKPAVDRLSTCLTSCSAKASGSAREYLDCVKASSVCREASKGCALASVEAKQGVLKQCVTQSTTPDNPGVSPGPSVSPFPSPSPQASPQQGNDGPDSTTGNGPIEATTTYVPSGKACSCTARDTGGPSAFLTKRDCEAGVNQIDLQVGGTYTYENPEALDCESITTILPYYRGAVFGICEPRTFIMFTCESAARDGAGETDPVPWPDFPPPPMQ